MANKVYIKVTEEMLGDPNIIATLEEEGGENIFRYKAEIEGIFCINVDGYITHTTLENETALIKQGYHKIAPQELTHTIHLHKGDTSLLVPLKAPEGYEAVVNGEVVTEIEVQLRAKRWMPEKGENYVSVDIDGAGYTYVRTHPWFGHERDVNRFNSHNVFKTKEEAKQFKEIIDHHYWQAVEEYETKS